MNKLPRMSAYYHTFQETGVFEIDMILSAVASAGKAFHNTSQWDEEIDGEGWGHDGECPWDWIQNAANKAAIALRPNAAE